jgi:peptidoglycan/xylan/chitin deacetylase (PgdA/CDA1 family)
VRYASLAHGADTRGLQGHVYLTLDTGNMRHAEPLPTILGKHQIKATFFVAQEKHLRGDHALDPAWGDYWKARVAEGHAFGSHTWRHGSFRQDEARRPVAYRLMDGRIVRLTLQRSARN